jgi:hypothetical protein
MNRGGDPRRRRPAPLQVLCCRLDQLGEDSSHDCRLDLEQVSRQASAANAAPPVTPLAIGQELISTAVASERTKQIQCRTLPSIG